MPENKWTAEKRESIKKKKSIVNDFLDTLVISESRDGRHLSETLPLDQLGKKFLGIGTDEQEEDPLQKKEIVVPYTSKILGEEPAVVKSPLDLFNAFQRWLDWRDEARKNLFWLGRDVLKKDFVSTTHQVVCDQFVQKNFDGVFKDGYTIGDVHKAIDRQERFDDRGNPTKELILLDPRGFFKSSIDGVDCVQWMLNVPDVRILILTGEYKLAVAFMKEIKGYLYLAKGEDPGDLHLLFPEYILRGVDGTSKEPFTLACRKHKQKEPTIWDNSIDSNLSGWHCDVKKGDDVVTDENCNSPEAREALKEKFDGTDNLLDEWGFSDNIGTRYFPDDWYGTRLAIANDNPVKYFCRQCWVLKPEFVETELKNITEDMVTLNFPEKATFVSLRRKLIKNERSFRCQQLNEPVAEDKEDDRYKVTFDEDQLRAHLYQATAAPKQGDVFICWDWAPSANKYSDFSVGVAARVYLKPPKPTPEGETPTPQKEVMGLVILEVIYGRWKSSELAVQIVNFNKKWNPKRTLIERSFGSDLLQMAISTTALKMAVHLDIFWKPPSSEENAKRNRIKGLETLLSEDRLHFVIGPWIDETFSQLTKYTGEKKNRGRKDDIPDSMSYLCFFLPTSTYTAADTEALRKIQKEQREAAEKKQQYERIFGSSIAVTPVAVVQMPAEDPRRAAMNRIFGGNGMRS